MSSPLDFARVGPRVVLGTTAVLIVALAALLSRIGADAQWLAALGQNVITHHSIPAGVPFAAAPTTHWPNALVLAELIMGGLERGLGDRGLMLAQLTAVGLALWILARDAQRDGAGGIGSAAALLVVAVGALPSLAIARVQLFSLVLFPLLVMLLRAQSRSPSGRIWLAVPLLAVWSNLHGAALLGAGMLIVYLIFERARREPVLAVGVAIASLAALCLTPALLRTGTYYHGVLTNLAAQRGEGMWGPLSLSAPLDLCLALGAAFMIFRMTRAHARRWEWCMVAILAMATVKADRDGVWLLFFLVAPAARVLAPARSLRLLVPVAASLAVAVLAVSLVRGPAPGGASRSLVSGAIALAHGSPVLADGSIDEQVALAGGRIWAGNPIDAFSRRVQTSYLDWLAGNARGASALTPAVHVVLVSRGSETQALMARTPGFIAARADGGAVLYERIG
ncbi:MAG: hypothetical protein ACRDNK_13575 [Solirubrobacteraceae bacterium]